VLSWAVTVVAGLCFGSNVRADLILDIASTKGADIEFKGSGTGASFQFNNNSGNGFVVTDSTGVGDSIGLNGTIGGTFAYTTASVSTFGPMQSALVAASGGTLTITDANSISLTGTIAAMDVSTLGTGGAVNVEGAINLTGVAYSGMNADLTQLRDEADASGGSVVLSFQFVPGESLTALTANGADHATSYSGTISTNAIPEPRSIIVAIIALCCVGCVLKKRAGLALNSRFP
jgi:hypothetical protein